MKLIPFDGELDPVPEGTSLFTGELDDEDQGVLSAVGETALNFAGNMMLTPLAGLRGLGALATGKGLEASVDSVGGVLEEAYQPRGERGKRYTENVGEVLNLPVEYGGKIGEAIGGNEGRLVGEIAGNFATDILPIVGGFAARGRAKVKPTTIVEKLKAEEPIVPEVKPPVTETPANYKATEGHDGQMALFDIPEEGRMPNPYEAVTGDWRIDENGMPIKADLSMDVQNAQQPLQRNLWGDELPQKHPQENPSNLPQAIDNIPAGVRNRENGRFTQGTTRGDALARLQNEIPASGELLAAKMAAEPTLFNTATRKQGGGIDPSVFVDGFQKVKELADGLKLIATGTGDNLNIRAVTRDGRQVGAAVYDRTNKYDSPKQSDLYAKALGSKQRGTAKELYKFANELGNDVIPSKRLTEGGKAVWNSMEKKGIAVNGKIPFNFKKQGGGLFVGNKEKAALDNSLATSKDGTLIPDNPNVSEAVKKALAEGKDGKLATYFQSGSTSAAMKTGSAAIKAASEIIQNATKRVDLAVRNAIFPAEKALKGLSKAEIKDLGDVFKEEMFSGRRFSADNLTKNLSVKQLDAYTHMRDMFDKSLDAQNDARLSKGQEPVSPKEAYMASRWQGDFRRPIHDADGKLVWYLASNSKLGLESQTKALLKKFPDLVVDKTKDHMVRSAIGKTDLQSMYTTMLDVLGRDDPAILKIKQAIEDQTVTEGETVRGQEKHFERKSNIRGFTGDRPGHNGPKEAIAMFQQQLQYAKNAFQWSEMQKAADDIKGIVSNPELQAQQPNNVKFIREYFKNAIGHGEAQAMRVLDDNIRTGLGISPKVIGEAIGDMKSFFILQKLAASAGFTLTNAIQTTNVIPYLADLRAKGYKGNPITALSMGATAGPLMAFSHYLKATGGSYLDKMPSQFIKDAIHYAEQNGVTARSIYDESPIQASFNPVAQAANVASKTMTIPETFVRSVSFMTYAQMLKDSGKYTDMSKLFQHAEELVNKSMVDYREAEKPLVFAKGGAAGNFMNTLQTYPMSFYNQYSYMAGRAMEGNPVPLVTMLALQGALAGAVGIPYAEDAYQAFKYIKDNMVSTSTWKSMQDSPFLSDPKMWMLETLGNSSVYGMLSDQTGLGLSSRISAPTVTNMMQSPVGPISDIAKQVKSVGSAVLDPTNSTKWAQAGMDVIPVGLAGLLETSGAMKDHTYVERPDGTKVFMKTTDLAKRDASISRSPEEEAIRKWGLRSQREVVERDVKYMTDSATQVANKKSGELIEKFYDAARRGDTKKASELASLYTRLTGKELSDTQLNQQVIQEQLTAYEKSLAKDITSPQEAINIARMKSILDKNK